VSGSRRGVTFRTSRRFPFPATLLHSSGPLLSSLRNASMRSMLTTPDEERHLVRFFGNDYVNYRKRVGTGLPFFIGTA
jgi:protein-S-isoprenylcysteine O-methyltransferase Ste14